MGRLCPPSSHSCLGQGCRWRSAASALFGRFRTGRHTAPKNPRHLSLKVTAETFQEVATGEGGGALDRATPGRTAPPRGGGRGGAGGARAGGGGGARAQGR